MAITPRKRFKPQKLLPKTSQEQPQLIGVYPNFVEINSLKLVEGRFFTEDENTRLGAGLRARRDRQGQPAGI